MDGLTCSKGCELANGHAGSCIPLAPCCGEPPVPWRRTPPVRKHKVTAARRRLWDLLQTSAADAPEIAALQRELAYEGACSIIISHCCARERGKGWWDLASVDDYAADDVRKAAKYLLLRGLLEQHTVNSSWVRLREDKTAEGTV
jgi:hypothetical protein